MFFKKILIVDDSSTARIITHRCFQIAGYSEAGYVFAEDGIEAFSMLKSNPEIDLIVTDLNMPKMDGENLIKKMRVSLPDKVIPILVITSLDDGLMIKELSGSGVIGIIQKPLTAIKIKEVLRGA